MAGFAHTRHATLRSVTKQRHNNRAATMPRDNAAPPTHRRPESIVCTSLVLLSSPALPRRAAKNEGETRRERIEPPLGRTRATERDRERRLYPRISRPRRTTLFNYADSIRRPLLLARFEGTSRVQFSRATSTISIVRNFHCCPLICSSYL